MNNVYKEHFKSKQLQNPDRKKHIRTRRQDEKVATVMVATARIAVAQIDPSYSSGGDDA